jgi:hypothetical protein
LQAALVANAQSVAATGKSIERLLDACFAGKRFSGAPARTALIRTEDFDRDAALTDRPGTGISIFLHRVDVNGTMRSAWSGVSGRDGQVHLPLDLHFLLTPWATNAEDEHHILGIAMECLETHPILTGPLLDAAAGWAPGEAVQLMVEDLPGDALMRMFDSLPSSFRLSVGYVARVVRIDATGTSLPVTTTIATGVVPPA